MLKHFLFIAPLFLVFSTVYAKAQVPNRESAVPPPSQCPVYASLATTKLQGHDRIVIWFWNQGRKTTHGVEFHLVMLDTVGNRYPSAQRYIAEGKVKPNRGDFIVASAKAEKHDFGASWENIDGVEVHVVSAMFADATTWRPGKEVECKTAFLNANYEKALEPMRKEMEQLWKHQHEEMETRRKTWNREHPNDQLPEPVPEPNKP
jgi:hypothetical protein